jgi:hypothetical protein
MTITGGPKIITDGMAFSFDADNVKSYPGTGDTWYDLSENKYHAVRVNTGNTISYSASEKAWFFDTEGTNNTTDGFYITRLNYVSGTSDQINNFTIEAWIKNQTVERAQGNDERIILSYDRSAVFRFAIGFDSAGAGNGRGRPFFGAFGGGSGDIQATSYSGDIRDLQWHHVIVAFEDVARTGTGSLDYYLDGVNIHSATGSYPALSSSSTGETPRFGWIGNGSEAGSEGGNIGPGNPFAGYMRVLRMYDQKTFTAAEVLQQYNATKGRFGL